MKIHHAGLAAFLSIGASSAASYSITPQDKAEEILYQKDATEKDSINHAGFNILKTEDFDKSNCIKPIQISQYSVQHCAIHEPRTLITIVKGGTRIKGQISPISIVLYDNGADGFKNGDYIETTFYNPVQMTQTINLQDGNFSESWADTNSEIIYKKKLGGIKNWLAKMIKLPGIEKTYSLLISLKNRDECEESLTHLVQELSEQYADRVNDYNKSKKLAEKN